MATKYPYNVEQLSDEEIARVKMYYTTNTRKYIRLEGYLLPETFLEQAEDCVRTMPLRDTDVFVVSFPRSGTTWTQELVWLLSNNFDFDRSRVISLPDRFPFLEYHSFVDQNLNMTLAEEAKIKFKALVTPAAEILAKLPKGEPRFIKSHLPVSLLPEGTLDTAKVIYVARDPRDVALSCYHFYRLNQAYGLVCDFKTYYYEIFCKDLGPWSPFFKHVKEAWAQRNRPNFLFIFYEELSKDLKGTAKRVSRFLGKEYSEEQYDRLCNYLQFDNFKTNGAVVPLNIVLYSTEGQRNFVRKGVAGGWREQFDEQMTEHAQRWMEHNLRDTDLVFPS